jgi:hypothetical protein
MARADPRNCLSCKKDFTPTYKQRKQKYCSQRCVWAGVRGPDFNRKISILSAAKRGDAQRGILKTGNSKYTKRDGRHEHRLVMEIHLGRKLLSNEIVHHINGDSKDNRLENLQLMSQADHIREHLPEMLKRKMERRAK